MGRLGNVIFNINEVQQPSFLHWDGGQWTASPAPVHNQENAYLVTVSALTASDLVAVGFYDTGPPLPKMNTLIERWDGRDWNFVQSADPGEQNYLYGVAAVAPDDMWAVGEAFGIELSLGTLVERYSDACPPANFLRGDANQDSVLDLSDAITSLGYQFLGEATPRCLDALDRDDNGQIEITDAIYLLAFLYQGGDLLPAPYPEMGPDPTADDPLDCRG